MHRFHCPELGTDTVVLPEEEAHHATHVLRLRAGDRIGLLDGHGTTAVGELIEVGKRLVRVNVLERTKHPPERAARIHLAVAPTKHADRFEWFVEKAVEVGVDRITPLLTERTERQKLRTDRLERIAVAAMKQSQRAWLPQVDAPIPLPELLRADLPGQRCFGWCMGEHQALMALYTPTTDAVVAIGPEGDFTVEEAERLRSAGFAAVSIGTARLRTETAALAACTWMSLAQQR